MRLPDATRAVTGLLLPRFQLATSPKLTPTNCHPLTDRTLKGLIAFGSKGVGPYGGVNLQGGGGTLRLCDVTTQYNTRRQMSYSRKTRVMNTPADGVSMRPRELENILVSGLWMDWDPANSRHPKVLILESLPEFF